MREITSTTMRIEAPDGWLPAVNWHTVAPLLVLIALCGFVVSRIPRPSTDPAVAFGAQCIAACARAEEPLVGWDYTPTAASCTCANGVALNLDLGTVVND